MSEQGRGGFAVEVTEMGAGTVAGLYTLPFFDEASLLENVDTVDDALRVIDNFKLSAARTLEAQVADKVDAIWDTVGSSLRDGELGPHEVSDMFRWLRYDKGFPIISAQDISGRPLSAWILDYAVAHGYKPPATYTPPKPKPEPSPTHAQKAVKTIAKEVKGHKVTAPGLTPAETGAISKALGVAYGDALRADAALMSKMLPGMAPGQVPEALGDLFRAAGALEHQMAEVFDELGGKASGKLAGQLGALEGVTETLQGAVSHLRAQMAAEAGSELLTDIQALQARQGAIGDQLGHVETELGSFAGAGELASLAGVVALHSKQFELLAPSALDTELNKVSSEIPPLRTATEDALRCCDANSAVTNPISEGGATPSLLRQLGGLLGKGFTLLWLASLAETALALIDAKAAVSGVVADTELLAKWATQAAGVITSDLSWQGALNGR